MSAATAETEAATASAATGKTAKATKADAPAAPEVTRVVGCIPPATCTLTEFANNRHTCVAAPGTLPTDLELNAEPFALVAHNLTRFDDVRVLSHEGTWLADLIVVDAGPGYAVCRIVQVLNLPARRSNLSDAMPPNHDIVQGGPGDSQRGWLVYRLSDGVLLNGGHIIDRREDALHWLRGHATLRGNETRPTLFGLAS